MVYLQGRVSKVAGLTMYVEECGICNLGSHFFSSRSMKEQEKTK